MAQPPKFGQAACGVAVLEGSRTSTISALRSAKGWYRLATPQGFLVAKAERTPGSFLGTSLTVHKEYEF